MKCQLDASAAGEHGEAVFVVVREHFEWEEALAVCKACSEAYSAFFRIASEEETDIYFVHHS